MAQSLWIALLLCACLCVGSARAQEPYWRQTYSLGPGYSFVSAAAFIPDNQIVFGGDGGLTAADVRSGVASWYKTGNHPCFAVDASGAIFTAEAAGSGVTVWRLTPDGRTAWELGLGDVTRAAAFGAGPATVGGVACAGGRVFVLVNALTGAAGDGTAYALTCIACNAETGRPEWDAALQIPGASGHFGSSLLAADDGRLFAAGNAAVLGQELDTAVFCLSQDDGGLLWSDSYTGLGNGIDEVVRNGLVVATDGELLALIASDGIDGAANTVIQRFGRNGARRWIVRFGSRDGPCVPTAFGLGGDARVYVAGTSGGLYASKRLFVNGCDALTGRVVWSASWRPGDGGPSGATALAVGARSLFVAGWASDCISFACMAPAVVAFDLATGMLLGSHVGESAPMGGQAMAAAFRSDGCLVTAGMRYDENVFGGSAEAMLLADLDQHDFLRTDANADGRVGLADVTAMLGYLFAHGPMPCLDAADVDDDGRVNLTDPIRLLLYLFATGRPPDAPFPACGPDGRPDLLPCGAAPGCAAEG